MPVKTQSLAFTGITTQIHCLLHRTAPTIRQICTGNGKTNNVIAKIYSKDWHCGLTRYPPRGRGCPTAASNPHDTSTNSGRKSFAIGNTTVLYWCNHISRSTEQCFGWRLLQHSCNLLNNHTCTTNGRNWSTNNKQNPGIAGIFWITKINTIHSKLCCTLAIFMQIHCIPKNVHLYVLNNSVKHKPTLMMIFDMLHPAWSEIR